MFQTCFWFNRVCSCFQNSWFPNIYFLILRFSKLPRIHHYKFGSYQNDTISITYVMFCNTCLYHISKKPCMFFEKYWFHIHDFTDFMKRIYIIFRCPSCQKLTNTWKSRYAKTYFVKCVHNFFYFLKYFGIWKSINKGLQGFKNPEIMEMLGVGPSHDKTKIRLDQNSSE